MQQLQAVPEWTWEWFVLAYLWDGLLTQTVLLQSLPHHTTNCSGQMPSKEASIHLDRESRRVFKGKIFPTKTGPVWSQPVLPREGHFRRKLSVFPWERCPIELKHNPMTVWIWFAWEMSLSCFLFCFLILHWSHIFTVEWRCVCNTVYALWGYLLTYWWTMQTQFHEMGLFLVTVIWRTTWAVLTTTECSNILHTRPRQ